MATATTAVPVLSTGPDGLLHPTFPHPSSAPAGQSSTTVKGSKPYNGPGAQTAQSGKTGPKLLSDIDDLLNAHGALGVLNVVDDIKVLGFRAAVAGVGFVIGIGGFVLVLSSIWGKAPAPVLDVAEATGGAAVVAAAG
jgi:hypothetical protein